MPIPRISAYSATLRDVSIAFRTIIDRNNAVIANVGLNVARDDTTFLIFDHPIKGWRLSQGRANALDIGDTRLRCVIDLSAHDIKDLYAELQGDFGSG